MVEPQTGDWDLHDSHPVTGVDHVDELLPVAGPGGVQLVGDRLVSGPPLSSLQEHDYCKMTGSLISRLG